MKDRKLTPHIKLSEFTDSETAAKKGIDNSVPDKYLPNVNRTAHWLEAVRNCELGGNPVTITSGYRCPKLNRAVGSTAKKSAHMSGLAIDIICPGFGDPLQVARALTEAPGLEYDQVIYEGRWVHIGLNEEGKQARQEVLTKVPSGYVRGLP